MAIPVLIDSGMLTSSAFMLPRARPFVVDVPSQSPVALFCDFSQTSSTAPWSRLQRTDGTGASYCVHSGGGNAVGVVLTPSSPWCRLAVSSGPSAPMSYSVVELNR